MRTHETLISETMDEKFASLEEKLIGEFADIKWLLYSMLEQQPDHLNNIRNAKLYDDDASNYLSPRQDEINKFNNTVQNLSTSNGWLAKQLLTYYELILK